MISTKKLLISCLIILAVGNLTACANKKVNKTEETNTQTTENQETNETEFQPEFVTVNYNNDGIYQYKVVKCDQDKAAQLIELGKPFENKTDSTLTVTFANGNELNGFECRYGQSGEHSFIRTTNGDQIETYDVLETRLIKPLKTEYLFEEGYDPKYIERQFTINYTDLKTTSTVTAVRCTKQETEYIDAVKFEAYNNAIITDEYNYCYQGITGCYGDTGEEMYIKLFIGNDEYYYKVIE